MSRRIEIELTSARPDGTWTWRAAGAREPKGVLNGSLLPADASAGGVYRADAEFELDGITILSVLASKEKSAKSGLLDLLPSEKPFEAVTQQLARRERGERPRRDGDRRRRDGEGRDGQGRDGQGRDGDRTRRDRSARHDRQGAEGGDRSDRPRRQRPHFEAPPELPQRPKPKRLRPGRKHRAAVLAELPEAQRPVAERALQGGVPAVRQAVSEQNARLKAEGKEEIPAAGLVAMAEQLLPKLRVAEWLDRADAAVADMEELDLRDLRSVVAAAEDPMVARDESTRERAEQLKQALVTKQERELTLWMEDIDAALGVGRVVRALKLSSQPPKAGVRFPTELAARLAGAAGESLTVDAQPDRRVAVLEAAAFSPVRAQVQASGTPTQVNDELTSTVRRIAPLLPQIAALFGVEVAEGAPPPKPLRPTRPAAKKAAPKPPARQAPAKTAGAPAATASADQAPVPPTAESHDDAATVEPAEVETPAVETPAVDTHTTEADTTEMHATPPMPDADVAESAVEPSSESASEAAGESAAASADL
jgi:hypothetical protein